MTVITITNAVLDLLLDSEKSMICDGWISLGQPYNHEGRWLLNLEKDINPLVPSNINGQHIIDFIISQNLVQTELTEPMVWSSCAADKLDAFLRSPR